MLNRLRRLVLVLCLLALSEASTKSRVLVLVDPFTSYLSGKCTAYCKKNGIRVVETVSEYSCAALGAEGQIVPEELRAPNEGDEMEWASERGIVNGDDGEADEKEGDEKELVPNIDDVFVIAESDAGVPVAERIQVRIGAAGNGHSPQLRDKCKQSDLCRQRGLPVNKQVLASSWKDAEYFLDETLWKPSKSTSRVKGKRNKKMAQACVVKPNRGVASESVHFCTSKDEVKRAVTEILSSSVYGELRANAQAVLVQEFTPGGEEYAVDTVTCNGVTRVAALWKYEKVKANGSPFIYQCSELVDVECSNERDRSVRRRVVNYAVKALQAQGLKYGPCHVEVKVHPRTEEPRLMEINARWHAQPFLPVVEKVLDVDAITLTMECFFDRSKFLMEARVAHNRDYPGKDGASGLNHAPSMKRGGGMIVHLVQRRGGTVRALRHVEQIEALPSVLSMSHDAEVGEYLAPTIDHRTHSGYVVLAHEDEEQVKRDYATILELQTKLVEFMPSSSTSSSLKDNVKEEEDGEGRKIQGPRASPASRTSAPPPANALGRVVSKVRRAIFRALCISGLAYTSLLTGILLLPEKDDTL